MGRLRLAILGASPCGQCHAACCRQNGHEYAVLLQEDERRKFAPYSMDVTIEWRGEIVTERVIPYVEGRCLFLDAEGRCRIYEDRPQSCRNFECVKGYHHGGAEVGAHSIFLQRNPRVLALLEAL